MYVNTHVRLSGEPLLKYVAVVSVEVGQAWFRLGYVTLGWVRLGYVGSG